MTDPRTNPEAEQIEGELMTTLESISTGSLFVNVDLNDLLETRSEEEVFALLGKLKDLLQ